MASRSRKTLSRSDWLDAALAALDAGGVESVRVLPLAESLGVSRGSFYWHFENRADLLRSVLDYWETELTDSAIDHATLARGDGRQRFRKLLEDVLEQRRGQHDPAVRAWALYDREAAKVVRRVDRKRFTYITSLFRDMGFSQSESEARAYLANVYLLGDHIILEKEPPAKRRRYLRLRHRMLTAP